jgi:hypothetical protein
MHTMMRDITHPKKPSGYTNAEVLANIPRDIFLTLCEKHQGFWKQVFKNRKAAKIARASRRRN